MIGFSAPLTQTTTHSQSTWTDVVQLVFVDLPHFLPALKFQSLTGMVDVKCMTVVLISACVYGDPERRGVGEDQGASLRNQRCLLVASGECCVVLIGLSLLLFVNALLLQLQPF